MFLMKKIKNSKHVLPIFFLLLILMVAGCSDGSIAANSIPSEELSNDSLENNDAQAIVLNELNKNISTNNKEEKLDSNSESIPSGKKLTPQELPNPPPANGKLTVHFIDVDQGDAILLSGPDFTILIDAGRHDRDDVVPYLKQVGVKELDLVVGTHPHADHIGQLDKVIKDFPIKEVWLDGNAHTSKTFERVIDAILDSGASYHEPRAGENFTIGSAYIEVIHPSQLTGEYNDDSIVLRITYGDIAFLFTGDIEQEGERKILNRGTNVQANILKIAHHGSSTSSTKSFLEKVNPDIAIYSAGRNNTYGHPHKEVVQRVKEMGIQLYGTDTHGTVIVETDGKTYTIKTKQDVQVSQQTPSVNPAPEPKQEPRAKPKETTSAPKGCVNINTATKEELMKIKHIGDKRAEEIIKLRPFSSVDDLKRVKGIGDVRLKEIKDEGIACVK